MHKRRRWGLFFRGERLHPFWRVLIYLLSVPVAQAVLALPLWLATAPDAGWLLIEGSTRLIAAVGIAWAMGRFLDREPVETMGLSPARLPRDGMVGLGMGLVAMGVIGGAQLALHWADASRGTATLGTVTLDVVALLPAAVAEEVAFRGYLQRAIGTWKGPRAGVVVTALLFALVHITNPHPSWLAMLNLALAGVLFALATERTGTLWLAIGFHFAWNLAQGPLLGMPISGLEWNGLVALEAGDPVLLTGGPFGPEGGLLATGVLVLSFLPLWALTRRPATIAAACRRQRACVEARFGSLPHLHYRLVIAEPYYERVTRSRSKNGREGEVVLLLRHADGSLLLHTKAFYPLATFRLHSGGIERGEPVIAAACREAYEETGLALQDARPIGLLTYSMVQGPRRFFFHSWVITGRVEGEPAVQDANERITAYRWVWPDALSQIAVRLRSLPPAWAGWGQFRAPAHDAASLWVNRDATADRD